MSMRPLLAPTQELLDGYKKRKGDWATYERGFVALMERRKIQHVLSPGSFKQRTALLCSEATAEHCHRRLVAEFVAEQRPDVAVIHL